MNNEDWIDETEKPVIEMPEAPGSIHIDSYLKGFHVGWTKRLTDANVGKELINVKMFVDNLTKEGFKPSWNEQTNQQTILPVDLGKCSKCGATNLLSKKGQPYCSDKCWLKV